MPLSREVIETRSRICLDCSTPCGANVADPCASCVLENPRWGKWDCDPYAPGDVLASHIEARVLAPIKTSFPVVSPIVSALGNCGGCTQTKHALGSKQVHPDAGSPII